MFKTRNLWMCANGLLIISCQFILVKMKLNALFSSRKKLPEFNIIYDNNGIKHFHIPWLLSGRYLSWVSTTMKSLKKINATLQFLYRQNSFLNPRLLKLWCNSLVQPHFDDACISWYLLVSQKVRKKVEVIQNICIRFCLKLN